LLLRLAVSTTVMIVVPGRNPEWLLLLLAAAAAAALCVGVMTPIAAGAVVILEAMAAMWSGFDDGPIAVVAIAVAIALALLGPGAYSIDSRWFGRRLIFESREEPSPARRRTSAPGERER